MMPLRLCATMVLASSVALHSRQPSVAAPPVAVAMPTLDHAVGYYDAERGRVVIVGEAAEPGDGARDRAWSWNGVRWEAEAAPGPPGRVNAGAAYDRHRRTAVVAGGARKIADAWRVGGDSWVLSGGEWEAIADIPPRDHHALVDTRGGVLLFGGIPARRSDAWPTDTFELRDGAWVRVATEGPAGRGRAAMAYDRARNEVVLFGGVSAEPAPKQPQTFFADTWIWSGSAWRKAAEGGPRGRYAHAMAFDERRGVVWLYAGAAAHKGAPLSDMWQWDGTRWTEVTLTGPTPGHRYQPVMVYDAARGRTVLHGGIGGDSDTWEWDGERWHRAP